MTVTYETFEHRSGVEEVAIIHNEDGSYTSMSKAEYDRRQAEHFTPNPTGLFNE
jgi:hypothetical protein